MFDTTIILISYKSEKLILNFIKKLPKLIPIIIIDNSNSFLLEDVIKKEYSNLEIFVKKNDGVSSALNYAVDKTKTKYFLQISPDINFDYNDILIYLDLAKKLNNRFAAIGPRFLDIKKKSHKQILESVDYDTIDSIHGSCMFINKECFNKIGRFDENYFLYFEETDFFTRCIKKNKKIYLYEKFEVKHGGSISINMKYKNDFYIFKSWHYCWSKFYYYRKHFNYLVGLSKTFPNLKRSIFGMIKNLILRNSLNFKLNNAEFRGLIKSYLLMKSKHRMNID